MLLIHSMREFHEVYTRILAVSGVRSICEIGVEHGGNTKLLTDYVSGVSGSLTCIDPGLGDEVRADLFAEPQVHLIEKASLDAIEDVRPTDAWFVDGDHNWYTVFNELRLIENNCLAKRKPFLAFLHDVGWPCARRDLYYAPERIPQEFRQPYDMRMGVTPQSSELIEGGFRGAGAFFWAHQEGGPRNGTLTAVEDFVAMSERDYRFSCIPGVFGLGILVASNHPFLSEIEAIIAPFRDNSLMQALENNRLQNYLEVIRLQDAFAEPQR